MVKRDKSATKTLKKSNRELAMRCRESYTEVIAMFDLETNKAIALRLIEVFNGRRLDLLKDVLHPEFRGRGISAFATDGPEVGPGARRKLYEMFYQAIPDALDIMIVEMVPVCFPFVLKQVINRIGNALGVLLETVS
jgi:hypothetical protein